MPESELSKTEKPSLLGKKPTDFEHATSPGRDAAVGIRPTPGDRVFTRGTRVPQMRPGGEL